MDIYVLNNNENGVSCGDKYIMMKRWIVYLSPLLLGGCDLIEDTYSVISNFVASYLPDIGCWISKVFATSVNFIVVGVCDLLTGLISVLPQYSISTVALSDNTILKYCAYFFPIGETATLLYYLFTFYLSYWFLNVVLRWLKIKK